MKTNIVDFAWQIIDMQRTIDSQEKELIILREYKEKYHKLVDSSIEHGRAMMGNVLSLAMTEGVIEACQKAAQKKLTTDEDA